MSSHIILQGPRQALVAKGGARKGRPHWRRTSHSECRAAGSTQEQEGDVQSLEQER